MSTDTQPANARTPATGHQPGAPVTAVWWAAQCWGVWQCPGAWASGLQLSSRRLVGEKAHAHPGAGRRWQALEGAPRRHPFPIWLCAKSPVSRHRCQGALGSLSCGKKLQSPPRTQPEAEPICRQRGRTKHVAFVAKAAVLPDLTQTLGRAPRAHRGHRIFGSEAPEPC